MTRTYSGDFYELLQSYQAQTGVRLPLFSPVDAPNLAPNAALEVHGTTVIALKFQGGVLNVGDRRATAANAVMYDRADKIIPLDDYTLIAIAGAYGRAMEVVRYLRHAFKYYARSQLQPMSLDGKLQEVSRALSANLPNALGGIGLFIPILSVYDPDRDCGRIFFYDVSGARFETPEYGAAGSGSDAFVACSTTSLRRADRSASDRWRRCCVRRSCCWISPPTWTRRQAASTRCCPPRAM